MDDEAELLLQNVPRINLDQVYENNEVSMANKNNKLVGRIKQAMEEQYLYKETGFTITNLAAILRVPEQRLRTTINRKLGF
tara:strand:+ start:20406 stop:20648 length:243 start_codon:yes stop_codon:yes gene_type:complete